MLTPDLELKLPPLFPFKRKPVLVGSMAKHFYGVDSPSAALDLVIEKESFAVISIDRLYFITLVDTSNISQSPYTTASSTKTLS